MPPWFQLDEGKLTAASPSGRGWAIQSVSNAVMGTKYSLEQVGNSAPEQSRALTCPAAMYCCQRWISQSAHVDVRARGSHHKNQFIGLSSSEMEWDVHHHHATGFHRTLLPSWPFKKDSWFLASSLALCTFIPKVSLISCVYFHSCLFFSRTLLHHCSFQATDIKYHFRDFFMGEFCMMFRFCRISVHFTFLTLRILRILISYLSSKYLIYSFSDSLKKPIKKTKQWKVQHWDELSGNFLILCDILIFR